MNPPAGNHNAIPPGWLGQAMPLVGSRVVNVAGFDTPVEVTRAQLERVYLPVLAMLSGTPVRAGSRVLAGLAGIPGSGKSTFAAVLAEVARILLPDGDFMTIGMDGWHLPGAVLETRTCVDELGRTVPLRERKGGADSFDVTGLAASLRGLKTAISERAVPVYDRRLHEPVARGRVVPLRTRLLLIEGNYLLCSERPWDDVTRQLAPKFFLECDPDAARNRVIVRHIRGGLSPEAAIAKYEANDRLNTQLVLNSSRHADACIRLAPEPAVRFGNSS